MSMPKEKLDTDSVLEPYTIAVGGILRAVIDDLVERRTRRTGESTRVARRAIEVEILSLGAAAAQTQEAGR